jgi:oligo-1,6-glucosidase
LPAEIGYSGTELLIGNYPSAPGEDLHALRLRPYEARVIRLRA